GRILDGILRSGTESRAWFASDDVAESAVDRASVGRLSEPKRYAGGCDNVAALIRAWDWAAENGGAVLWLHGTQPMESDAIEALTQRWERQRGGAPVYALQFGRGPDRLADRIGEHPLFRPIGPVLDPAGDVAAWMAGWSGEAGPLAWERTMGEAGAAAPADAVAGSSQLVRLWALDEVRRLAGARSQDATARAIELAKTWQLVTPLTGAVVLETQAQYKAAGLKDIDPATAPDIIPEPLTLLLLGPGVALLFILRGLFTLWGGRLRARLRP
ncbi:MAG: hypothetical protein NT049_00430, partial [Planctomycetota bacterium]|nr:hypothetical protein [Planctomycetota bacterium]